MLNGPDHTFISETSNRKRCQRNEPSGVRFDAAIKGDRRPVVDMVPQNRHTRKMNKTERQEMIRKARDQDAAGIKRKRIASNLGISERWLRKLLNNK